MNAHIYPPLSAMELGHPPLNSPHYQVTQALTSSILNSLTPPLQIENARTGFGALGSDEIMKYT